MAINKMTVAALAAACLAATGAAAQDADQGEVNLPRDVVSAATAFAAYTASAAAIGPFSNSQSVGDGLRTGVAYEPVQLEEGMIAYGALAALQDDAFVDGVEHAASGREERRLLAQQLIDNPFEATQFDGAAEAGARVVAALDARAAPLTAAGSRVKISAYTVQHQAWSKLMVADAPGRLAEVKRLSAVRADPSDTDSLTMLKTLADLVPAPPGASAGFTDVEARALALAAEAVLDETGDDEDDGGRLAPLLTEQRGAECLKMAKLNLYQCMAVAGPQYEDMFCLGQHAMIDTGACVSDAAHHGLQTRITTVAAAAPEDGAVYLPLAAHRSLRLVTGH